MYSGTQRYLIYAGLFFAALLFSLVVNSVFMRFFRTFGIREQEGMVRWAASSKPAFGGIGFFIFFFMWVRWTVPRFRYDQVMKLGWQKLLPLAIANLLFYAILIAFIQTRN